MKHLFGSVMLALMLAFVALAPVRRVHALETCPSAGGAGAVFSNICVGCLFPITIAGAVIGGSPADVPIGADMSPVCFCKSFMGIPIPGITIGMWIPKRVVESVRNPYCSPTLGGSLGGSAGSALGGLAPALHGGDGVSVVKAGKSQGFHNVHVFLYPIGEIIGDMLTTACLSDASGPGLIYVSELDPSWNNDQLAELMTPEAAVFANEASVASCMADAAASTTYQPIPSMYWCMGSWGTSYPFDGNTTTSDAVRQNSLVTAKAVARLQRFGLIFKTMGPDAVCNAYPEPVLVKNQYKFQQLWPFPEATSDHWMGADPNLWGEWRHAPIVGEDYVTLNWQFSNCCLY